MREETEPLSTFWRGKSSLRKWISVSVFSATVMSAQVALAARIDQGRLKDSKLVLRRDVLRLSWLAGLAFVTASQIGLPVFISREHGKRVRARREKIAELHTAMDRSLARVEKGSISTANWLTDSVASNIAGMGLCQASDDMQKAVSILAKARVTHTVSQQHLVQVAQTVAAAKRLRKPFMSIDQGLLDASLNDYLQEHPHEEVREHAKRIWYDLQVPGPYYLAGVTEFLHAVRHEVGTNGLTVTQGWTHKNTPDATDVPSRQTVESTLIEPLRAHHGSAKAEFQKLSAMYYGQPDSRFLGGILVNQANVARWLSRSYGKYFPVLHSIYSDRERNEGRGQAHRQQKLLQELFARYESAQRLSLNTPNVLGRGLWLRPEFVSIVANMLQSHTADHRGPTGTPVKKKHLKDFVAHMGVAITHAEQLKEAL